MKFLTERRVNKALNMFGRFIAAPIMGIIWLSFVVIVTYKTEWRPPVYLSVLWRWDEDGSIYYFVWRYFWWLVGDAFCILFLAGLAALGVFMFILMWRGEKRKP